ncbi:MAG: PIN domain-containing protein [Candidatus Helarchaeota archaeon]|nr:PIN domain-containing protein [Candidatus Helarchaeota archaeon]
MKRIGLDTGIYIASVKKKGEKFHDDIKKILKKISFKQYTFISSALILIEIPGGLCASTSMPIQKIYETEKALEENFKMKIFSFDPYIIKAKELMFEFRELKRKFNIESADFHHLATVIQENCPIFLTIDEHHLLKDEFKLKMGKYIDILNPTDFLRTLNNP